VVLWRRDGSGDVQTVPFRCKSWRCPSCRPHVALVDYARIAQGLAAHRRWIYVVLTLPAEARRSTIWRRYRRAGELWDGALRHRLRRRYGAIRYVQTWEAHADGTPHVNIVLGGDQLLEHVEELGDGPERRHPYLDRPVRVPRWRAWWLSQARECGFGKVGWVERLWSRDLDDRDPRDGLAAYMTKLAHGLGVAGGSAERGDALAREISYAGPKDQTPAAAPRGFRRLRASRGVLPPRWGPGEWTGTVRPAEETWNWERVESWAERRSSAIAKAVDALCELSAKGLPIPVQVLRLALRDETQGFGSREERAGRRSPGRV
jgi:hypothetical protein